MEGWVKWLGEAVWRLTNWPKGVPGNEREENFWYRTYGVGSLILALVTGLWIVGKVPGPIAKLVALANTYTGADKPLAQGYIAVLLALLVGIPMVFCGVFLLASTILFVSFVVIGVTKGLGLAIGWAVAKYLERRPKEAQAAATGAILGALLGWFAGLYSARSHVQKEVAAAAAKTLSPAGPEEALRATSIPPHLLATMQSGGSSRELG